MVSLGLIVAFKVTLSPICNDKDALSNFTDEASIFIISYGIWFSFAYHKAYDFG